MRAFWAGSGWNGEPSDGDEMTADGCGGATGYGVVSGVTTGSPRSFQPRQPPSSDVTSL